MLEIHIKCDLVFAFLEIGSNIQFAECFVTEIAAIGLFNDFTIHADIENFGCFHREEKIFRLVGSIHVINHGDMGLFHAIDGAIHGVQHVAVFFFKHAVKIIIAVIKGDAVFACGDKVPFTRKIDGCERFLRRYGFSSCSIVDEQERFIFFEFMCAAEIGGLARDGIDHLVTYGDGRGVGVFCAVDEIINVIIRGVSFAVSNFGHVDHGICSDFIHGEDHAAICFVFTEKLFCVFKEHFMLRKNDLFVCFLTDDERVALYLAVALHHDLITEVEIHVLLFKSVDDVHQVVVIFADLSKRRTLFFAHLEVIIVVEVCPCGGFVVDNECVHGVITLGKDHANAAHRIIEGLVILPPRLLDIHRRRIVALTQTTVGVTFQMLTEQVDTAHHLIFIDPFQLIVTYIMTAKREGFGKYLLFTSLTRHRAKLMSSKAGIIVSAEPIHARNVEIFVMRHTSAVGEELGGECFFQNKVTCEGEIVCFAPIVDLLHEIFGEKLGDHLPEADTGGLIVANCLEKLGQARNEVITIGFLIFLGHDEAPRNTVSGDLRLVSEKAVDLALHFFVVRLVDLIQKILNDHAVERIHVIGIHIKIEMIAFYIGNGALSRFFAHFIAQIFLLIAKTFAVDNAAAKAAGPAVFVISPRMHTAFCGFIGACFDVVKPFVTHIFSLQTAARVHKKAADACFVHFSYLFTGFFGVKLFIP